MDYARLVVEQFNALSIRYRTLIISGAGLLCLLLITYGCSGPTSASECRGGISTVKDLLDRKASEPPSSLIQGLEKPYGRLESNGVYHCYVEVNYINHSAMQDRFLQEYTVTKTDGPDIISLR